VAKTRCFTLRLPPELYVDVFELADARGKTLNATVIELIRIAMSNQMDVRAALQKMLDREFGLDAITAESG